MRLIPVIRLMLLMPSAAAALMAQEAAAEAPPVWEYATVRLVGFEGGGSGVLASPPKATFLVCRGGGQNCQMRTLASASSVPTSGAQDGGLVSALNDLGKEGFEVTGVLPQSRDSQPVVLLKRKLPNNQR